MAAQQIGTVSETKGEVFARNADGQMRRLSKGDPIFERDVIITAAGSSAQIAPTNGPVLNVAEQQTVSVDGTVVSGAPADPSSGGVSPLAAAEAARVIQDPNALLEEEAAAAGLTGGDGNSGHGFVDLLRISEGVGGAAYDFPVYDRGGPQLPGVGGDIENGLPTAGNLDISLDEDDVRYYEYDAAARSPSWLAAFNSFTGDAYPNAGVDFNWGNDDLVSGDDLPRDALPVMVGNLNFSYGPDGVGNIVFNLPTEALTSGGNEIHYWMSADGHSLVGYIINDGFGGEDGGQYGGDFESSQVTVIFAAEITDVATGGFRFVLYGPLDHSIAGTEDNLVVPLSFTVTDATGDAAVGTLTVNIDDDLPVFRGEDYDQEYGGEDFVVGSTDNVYVEEESVPGSGGNNEADWLTYTRSGTIHDNGIRWGADGFGGVTAVTVGSTVFSVPEDGSTHIYFDAQGNVIPEAPVFQGTGPVATPNPAAELVVNSNGNYTFTVLDAMQHTAGDGENWLNLPSISITAVDSDGDPINVGLNISVQDDVPILTGEDVSATVDEDDIATPWSQGTSPNDGDADGSVTGGPGDNNIFVQPAFVSGSLAALVSFGADGKGSFGFTADAVAQLQALHLYSKQTALPENGLELTYSQSTNGNYVILTAYEPDTAGHGDTGNPVFQLKLNTATGQYEFRLYDELIHAAPEGGADQNFDLRSGPDGSISSIDFGSIVMATDGDGDSVTLDGKFNIQVRDDIPEVDIRLGEDAVLHDESAGLQGDDTSSSSVSARFTSVANTGNDPDVSGSGAIGFARSGGSLVRVDAETGADAPPLVDAYSLVLLDQASGLKTTEGNDITLSVDAAGRIIGTVSGGVNNGKVAFAVAIDGEDGEVFIAQYLSLKHPDTGDHDESVNLANKIAVRYTITDSDGDTVSDVVGIGTRVQFDDDGPEVSVGTRGTLPTLGVDETNLAGNDTENFANNFSVTRDYGSDGARAESSTTTSYSLGVKTWFGHAMDSGLDDVATGNNIFLYKDGADVVGRVGYSNGTANSSGAIAFRVSVTNAGDVTLDQVRALEHPNASNPNDTVTLRSSDLITLTQTTTITDGDGDTDTDSATIDIGTRLSFADDGPSIDVSLAAAADALVVDDSTLSTNATASFADNFTFAGNYGADGAGSLGTPTYALSVKSTGADSGLDDVATGQNVLLRLNTATGKVEGYTQTSNQVVFTVSVNSAGIVELDQIRAIKHDPNTGPDQSTSLSASDLIKLTQTRTIMDRDGDTASDSATLNIGTALSFKDDAPCIDVSVAAAADALVVDDSTLSTNATASFADNFTFNSNYGADGAGSLGTPTYALSVKSAGADSGLDDVATGQNVLLRLNTTTGKVEGYTQTSNQVVFTVSVNSAGTVELDQIRAIKHDPNTGPDQSTTLSASDLIALTQTRTITDRDGDTDSDSATINIGKALSFKDDGPSIDVAGPLSYTLHLVNHDHDSSASYNNSFGYYIKDANGNPTTGVVVWDNVKNFNEETLTIEGYTPGQIGFFIIPNGDRLNPDLAAKDEVTFVKDADGWHAKLGDTLLTGTGANILFDVGTLNVDGISHVTDNAGAGNLNWEDIAWGGDLDWNDLNIGATWTSNPNLPVLTTQDAETIGENSDTATGDFSGVFTFNGNYGADGAGTTVKSYSLGVTNTASGLKSNGLDITLAKSGNDIVGSTTAGNVFRISVDGDGKVTLTQYAEVDHVGENSDLNAFNNSVFMTGLLPGRISLTASATITDRDGDTESDSSSLDISWFFRFEDDVPRISLGTLTDTITLTTQDAQTIGTAFDTAGPASFKTVFENAVTANYGADGEGTKVVGGYALNVTNGTDSGLNSNGLDIILNKVGNDVVGSTSAGEVFRISVDASGNVTLKQSAEVDHIEGGAQDDQIALANGKVTLTALATVTDGDGDAVTSPLSLDLGGNIRFDDDVPDAVNEATQTLFEGRLKTTVTDVLDGEKVIWNNPSNYTSITTMNGLSAGDKIAVDLDSVKGSDDVAWRLINTVTNAVAQSGNVDGDFNFTVSNAGSFRLEIGYRYDNTDSMTVKNVTVEHTDIIAQNVSGNVLDNDSFGADGAGMVTAITTSGGVTTPVAETGTTITTSKGVLTIYQNGTYTYSAKAGVTSSQTTDTFTYTMVDGDGDSDTALMNFLIKDAPAVVPSAAYFTMNTSNTGGGGTTGEQAFEIHVTQGSTTLSQVVHIADQEGQQNFYVPMGDDIVFAPNSTFTVSLEHLTGSAHLNFTQFSLTDNAGHSVTLNGAGGSDNVTIQEGASYDGVFYTVSVNGSGTATASGPIGYDVDAWGGGGNVLVLDSVSNSTDFAVDLGNLPVDGSADLFGNLRAINMSGNGGTGEDNRLSLSLTDVLDVVDSGNKLYISGDAGDTVVLKGSGWSSAGTQEVVNSVAFDVYTNAANATISVLVETDVSKTLNG